MPVAANQIKLTAISILVNTCALQTCQQRHDALVAATELHVCYRQQTVQHCAQHLCTAGHLFHVCCRQQRWSKQQFDQNFGWQLRDS